jgi:hypothetical protein
MIWYERVLNYEGELCPLKHLRTFSKNVTIQKTNKTIELNFQILVKFSTHCVSVKQEGNYFLFQMKEIKKDIFQKRDTIYH